MGKKSMLDVVSSVLFGGIFAENSILGRCTLNEVQYSIDTSISQDFYYLIIMYKYVCEILTAFFMEFEVSCLCNCILIMMYLVCCK